MIAALESGFFRREIAEASFAEQREVEAKRKIIVGVNAFQEPEETPIELLERRQLRRAGASRGLYRVEGTAQPGRRAPCLGRSPPGGLGPPQPAAARFWKPPVPARRSAR